MVTLLWSLPAVLPLVRVALAALPIKIETAIAGVDVGVAPRILDWLALSSFVVVLVKVPRSCRCNSMISRPRRTTEHSLRGARSQQSVRRVRHRRCVAAKTVIDFRRGRFDNDS